MSENNLNIMNFMLIKVKHLLENLSSACEFQVSSLIKIFQFNENMR